MTQEQVEKTGTPVRALAREMVSTVVEQRGDRTKEIARLIWREPLTKRSWSEFFYLTVGAPIAVLGVIFVAVTLSAGIVLAITFLGLFIIALSVRGARGIGGFHRQLARGLLGEEIADPDPFAPRPGLLGWLQSALRDRTRWAGQCFVAHKLPLRLS